MEGAEFEGMNGDALNGNQSLKNESIEKKNIRYLLENYQYYLFIQDLPVQEKGDGEEEGDDEGKLDQ